MIKEVDEALVWLQGPTTNWTDELGSLDSVLHGGFGDMVQDKMSDDKLARDVDDLSAIFEDMIEDGSLDDVELLPPSQASKQNDDQWISQLDRDVENIEELSKVFDELEAEHEDENESVSDDMIDSDYESDEEDHGLPIATPKFVPIAPSWIPMTPVDPRSCIRSAVFQKLDPRIPQISIPRIDLAFHAKPVSHVPRARPAISPTLKERSRPKYTHDPLTCWICKSSNSPYRKHALHRYVEKRYRRNWKKGPRYAGRSNVAAARVRNGGRFICTTQWI